MRGFESHCYHFFWHHTRGFVVLAASQVYHRGLTPLPIRKLQGATSLLVSSFIFCTVHNLLVNGRLWTSKMAFCCYMSNYTMINSYVFFITKLRQKNTSQNFNDQKCSASWNIFQFIIVPVSFNSEWPQLTSKTRKFHLLRSLHNRLMRSVQSFAWPHLTSPRGHAVINHVIG